MADLTLKDLFILIKKRWWFIAILSFFFVSLSGYLSFFYLTPKYTNYTTLLVNDRNTNQQGISLNDIMLYEKLIGTYKDIIMSKRILLSAADKFDTSYESLRSMIRVTSSSNSQVITVSVTDSNHRKATDIANFVAETFSNKLPEIMTIDNVQILDSADYVRNPVPVTPNIPLNMGVAFIIGLILSSVFVVTHHFVDSRVRTEEELNQILEMPFLGRIHRYDKASRKSSNYLAR